MAAHLTRVALPRHLTHPSTLPGVRSRPTLELLHSPSRPRPGDRIQFEARLLSRSVTPVSRVMFHFSGHEERLHAQGGQDGIPIRHTWFNLYAEAEKTVLRKGEHLVLPFHFDLPEDLPPSFRSPVSKVEYRLAIRVEIPWWVDRTASYAIRVWPSPALAAQLPGAFLATQPRGPAGKEVHLELTLDRTGLELGGEVEGAISVENVHYDTVRRLELAVVLIDAANGRSAFGPQEIYRSDPIVLEEKQPEAGAAYPFRLRLPDDVVPSFTSKHIRVRWFLEARAVIRFGKDVVLLSELHVAQPLKAGDPARLVAKQTKTPRIAPLGRERRALVWASVARLVGLQSDPEGETMTGKIGPIALTVMLELRGAQLYSVASLSWPSLHLEVDVAERRWRDAFSAGLPLGDEGFDKRFTVRGRDPAQLQILLNPGVRTQLMGFERAELDDEGAALVSPGNGYTVDGLEPFVRSAVDAANALSWAFVAVPPPALLAADRAAWLAFAEKIGGRFEVGAFAIRGAKYRDAPVELITRFHPAGAPLLTVARARFEGTKPVTLEAQRVLAGVATECQGVRIADDAVEATLPSPLSDPSRAESLWRALARVVKALG